MITSMHDAQQIRPSDLESIALLGGEVNMWSAPHVLYRTNPEGLKVV
jgi:hypothetical protein